MQYLLRSTKQEELHPEDDKLFHIMWIKEAMRQDVKDASIIHLFKRKRNPQLCDNHLFIVNCWESPCKSSS